MDLSSVHGNKLQMLFSHHYKSVDVRVQIKEMFLFFPIFKQFHSYFPIFFQVIWYLTPCSGSNSTRGPFPFYGYRSKGIIWDISTLHFNLTSFKPLYIRLLSLNLTVYPFTYLSKSCLQDPMM